MTTLYYKGYGIDKVRDIVSSNRYAEMENAMYTIKKFEIVNKAKWLGIRFEPRDLTVQDLDEFAIIKSKAEALAKDEARKTGKSHGKSSRHNNRPANQAK